MVIGRTINETGLNVVEYRVSCGLLLQAFLLNHPLDAIDVYPIAREVSAGRSVVDRLFMSA